MRDDQGAQVKAEDRPRKPKGASQYCQRQCFNKLTKSPPRMAKDGSHGSEVRGFAQNDPCRRDEAYDDCMYA